MSECGFTREPTAAVSSSSSSLPGACDVALVCWQPMGVDWTAAIRASASFQEYVLVGEVDDGICGDPSATWGVRVHDSGDSGDSGVVFKLEKIKIKIFSHHFIFSHADPRTPGGVPGTPEF